jgi:hypothetical protein
MITNTGKNILAKYLIGQAPAYASYIAVGCGAKPVASDAILEDYSDKKSLNFEMFRVPIISRGYVTEDNVSKIVFTAELPSEERYEISEVGVYSAGSNASAGAQDSKPIYAFTQGEPWEYHTDTLAVAIPPVYQPLDGENNDNIIDQSSPVFQTNADNKIFTNSERVARYERCRFLNNIISMAGNTSNLGVSGGHLTIGSGSSHIHVTGADVNLNKNAPTDELRLAFSVINKDGESLAVPDTVRILVDFASTDIPNSGEFARFEVDLDNGVLQNGTQHDFENNRYVVVSRELQELYKSTGFTWSTVDVVKVFACVIKDGEPSDDFYVCLDALRLENTTTVNPLYGMTGYSVIKNTDSKTIVKSANTTNFIEFRFAMDVQ